MQVKIIMNATMVGTPRRKWKDVFTMGLDAGGLRVEKARPEARDAETSIVLQKQQE